MLPHYLVRLLRYVLKFLTSISSTHRPAALLAFLAFLRRRLFHQNTNTGIPVPDHRQAQCIHPSTTRDDSEKAICAMTAPSHKSPEPQYGRPSPVDAPYEMSSSGHLIPCSPAPSRQYTREHIPWISGSQTSLHAEPNAIDPESPHPVIHTPDGGATCESPRSKTPLSIRSTSQKSTSHRSIRSHNSAVSIGRASYRQHHGPPPRGRTPTPSIGQGRPVLVTGSSVTLGRAAPDSSSATPGRLVAPPNADDPNRPGEPTVNYNKPRFAPMSTHGVLRYQRHKQPNAIK
jgi:hypothetical protein